MKYRPIIMSSESIKAILSGNKTQTRRVVKFPKSVCKEWGIAGAQDAYGCTERDIDDPTHYGFLVAGDMGYADIKCPYGAPGDGLWVKETWMASKYSNDGTRPAYSAKFYKADGWSEADFEKWKNGWSKMPPTKWKSPLFMPRSLSRINLIITEIKAELIQDISVADCREEGMPKDNTDLGVRYCFGQHWNSINEKRGFSWKSNPWVWVITFRREL